MRSKDLQANKELITTPKKLVEIEYTELVKLVGNHHNPKPLVIVQCFKFHSHFRKSRQSVANFIAELQQLSEDCDFKDVLNDMLHDRLVCSINNDTIQRCLLEETPPLAFKKALEILFTSEMAANDAKNIQKNQAGSQSVAVHHMNREAAMPSKKVESFRCGGAHYANDCKFKETVCLACNKKRTLHKNMQEC